jgi:kynurenine formamidase
MRVAVVSALLGLLLQGATARAELRFVDLTHPFSKDSVYWPTADGFHLQVEFEGMAEHGYYSAYSFRAAEHGGTHIDAPVHFAQGKDSVDEIPLERLIAPGIVLDVSERVGGNADYRVSVADFEAWESRHGALPGGTIVLLHTGWGRFYPDRARYLGTDERGAEAVAQLHFPGLDPAAARWLVAEREIAAIGLDTPSIDYGQSTGFESHHILFEAQIPAFENVAHLDQLPATGFQVIALPMKIQGGSGGPLRIVAVVGAP